MDGQLNLGYWFTLLEPSVSSGDASASPQSRNTSPARYPGGAGAGAGQTWWRWQVARNNHLLLTGEHVSNYVLKYSSDCQFAPCSGFTRSGGQEITAPPALCFYFCQTKTGSVSTDERRALSFRRCSIAWAPAKYCLPTYVTGLSQLNPRPDSTQQPKPCHETRTWSKKCQSKKPSSVAQG